MHKLQLIIPAAAAVALVATAGAGVAQPRRAAAPARAPAPAAAEQAPTGPAIPNVCVFNTEEAIARSAVGKYVGSRLQQIQAQVRAEIQGDATQLQTDEKAFVAKRATLSSDAQQQQERALAARERALQEKAQLRNRELEATQQKALGRIGTEMQPILASTARSHSCGLVVNGQAVLGFNPAMDLTPTVVTQLDAKITQFPFEREHLDTGAAAPAAGAAR